MLPYFVDLFSLNSLVSRFMSDELEQQLTTEVMRSEVRLFPMCVSLVHFILPATSQMGKYEICQTANI